MTTTVCTPLGEGADSGESGALDPFQDLRHLLPKLAQPSWVRLIGEQMQLREKLREPSPDALKIIRRKDRKRSRILRALAGEHTRARGLALS